MKVFIIFMILFLLKVYAQQGQEEWRVVGTPMKFPVSAARVVYKKVNDLPKFYVLGGYSDSLKEVVDWIQEFDLVSGKWKIVGHMKTARSFFVTALFDNKIFSLGGVPLVNGYDNSIESWDILAGDSSIVYDYEDSFSRQYATGHLVSTSIYLIGGNKINSSENIPYIVQYDLINKKVLFTLDFPSMEKPQEHMSMFVNDAIYIYGGNYNVPLNWISKFSISTKQLERLPQTLIEPRAGGAAVYNQQLQMGFIVGGYNEGKKNGMKTTEKVIFNGDGTVSVYEGAPLKYARINPMLVSYENTVVVFGGKGEDGKIVPYIELLFNPQKPTPVISEDKIPTNFTLSQNYPNPFNPTTNISFTLPHVSYVTLKVYDVLGKEISTLLNGEISAGNHSVLFNAINLPSGVYFYRLEAHSNTTGKETNFISTKKMLLIK
ncbi:T9SS type A sorting domain-containing protein [Melioribacteraceae bacterium 4301-Me]|uniref:T9SS type A sorting domain-containing protein n=1 Tax=Pyranulibacter aquaticus TaxID=3163344 RepID=UPI003597D32D